MTPDALAALHGRVFTVPRPWSAAEIAGLLDSAGVFLLTEPQGFLMGRAIAGEAELLTLAVAPEARRQGIGARLVAGFLTEARARQAESAFLEVAADNGAALALYDAAGFRQAGRRRGYYATAAGPVDALVLSRAPI
ncbi:MAG: rimI [Cereibacter sp.]|nr:rimI [Cereibacter sp.]